MQTKHIVALGALFVLLGGGYYLYASGNKPTGTAVTAAPAHTYTADSAYATPAGSENVTFTVQTDAAGLITSAKSSVGTDNPISSKRQVAWNDAIGQVVVGKKLADLKHVDAVGGSSLTSAAFNDALGRLSQVN